MIKKMFSGVLVIILAVVFWSVIRDIPERSSLGGVSEQYATRAPRETGAANIVTAVIVTYRGLDTLGEIAVLFAAATGIALLLKRKKSSNESTKNEKTDKRPASEILKTGSGLLVPVIVMFGVYIFLNGHLTPGGGFQGGAVIASAVLLLFLSDTDHRLDHTVFGMIESLSGFFYVIIGILGIILAGGFLDNSILPYGEFGTILSAGAIPVIYIMIGLKVGTELAGILENLKGGGE